MFSGSRKISFLVVFMERIIEQPSRHEKSFPGSRLKVTGCKWDRCLLDAWLKGVIARLKRDIKKTSFLGNCCSEKMFYLTSLAGEETKCKSDAFKTSD